MKTRRAGGESLQDASERFEVDVPRSEWQLKMRTKRGDGTFANRTGSFGNRSD
jgi:hypothetical protein